MDEIRELLNNLAALSAEDLERLKGLIVAEFQRVDGEDIPDLALLEELATASEQVMAQADQLAAEAVAAEQTRAAARDRIAKLNPPADDTDTPAADADSDSDAGDPADDAADTADTPVPVAASGQTLRKMARRQPTPAPSPEVPDSQPPRTSLVASSAAHGVTPGTALDKRSLAQAMTQTLARRERPAGKSGGRGTDVIVASADWSEQYPEDRVVRGEYEYDQRIVKQAFEPDALVATGGICAPVNVDWAIGMIATADRPVRDGLPAFQAGRGGLIYRPDLDFGALTTATGIWTEATDLSPAGATKPIYTVACPSTSTVYVEAVSTRLGFGNMQSRFDPETVTANTDAALAAYARVADNNLLNLIAAQCTSGVTNTQILGATRDLLETLGQVVAAFRNLHRVPRSQQLRAIFPDWLKELIRIDLARETAHQQDGQWNSLMVSDQQIEDLFGPYGVSPIWHLDGQPNTVTGGVAQVFTTQSTGAINTFPTKCVWYIYYEGAFQLLDGGRLDLGIVRDSLLDSTNDYETFVEVFETIAYRGFTGGALQMVTTLCASGGSAGTIDTHASCP